MIICSHKKVICNSKKGCGRESLNWAYFSRSLSRSLRRKATISVQDEGVICKE